MFDILTEKSCFLLSQTQNKEWEQAYIKIKSNYGSWLFIPGACDEI